MGFRVLKQILTSYQRTILFLPHIPKLVVSQEIISIDIHGKIQVLYAGGVVMYTLLSKDHSKSLDLILLSDNEASFLLIAYVTGNVSRSSPIIQIGVQYLYVGYSFN